MNQNTLQDTATLEAELALLRRRFARSESARGQAEALLEDKSRVLAEAIDSLNYHQDLLANQLNQRTRQLLDAQRVAGFGTMIWDIEAERGELSPHAQSMLGLTGPLKIATITPVLHRVVKEDFARTMAWARSIVRRAMTREQPDEAEACPGKPGGPSGLVTQSADCTLCPERDVCELGLTVRVQGITAEQPNRMIKVMAQSEFDETLGHTLIFLTMQDVTREVEASNEAEALRLRDQMRLAELERLTTELQAARDAAEAANSAKSRFLAMMSHDIRTPMNGVLGMLELFEEEGLTGQQRQTLAHVKASGDQLRMLLDDIIDLEKAEAGKLKLNRQPVEVTALLDTAIGFWAKAVKDKGLDFVLEKNAFDWPEPPPKWVNADRQRLRQLVDNLLSNAIKFTSQGCITVRIGVIGLARMRFEVIDTGVGLPPNHTEELFKDFSQIYSSDITTGGAGLGLAICKRIVDLKGGEIGLEPGPGGRGCRAWVEIPFHEIPEPETQAGGKDLILRHPDGRRPRILVVEDVETNRIVARGMLGKLGCDVELVGDGGEAVEIVQRSPFDLVLMDMNMPGMDGPEATRRIRGLDAPVSQIPIIALTAFSRPEELAPMLAAGAQGSINKPIVLEQIHKAISEICCQFHGDGNQIT